MCLSGKSMEEERCIAGKNFLQLMKPFQEGSRNTNTASLAEVSYGFHD